MAWKREPNPYNGWLACAADATGRIIYLAKTYEEHFREIDLMKHGTRSKMETVEKGEGNFPFDRNDKIQR